MPYAIAIDGPVGAGKSSVADDAAAQLGILHLDTGAMYRAIAYRALQEGIDVTDGAALNALCERCVPEIRFENGKQRTLIAGEDVTDRIRTPEVSMAASTVSKGAGVRQCMVAQQRKIAETQSMIVDGRDIGTRVLPNAQLKIYLTASAKVRARRRYDEMIAKGQEAEFEDVLHDVEARDLQDTTREVDPLRPADDAQILDSSLLTQEQTAAEIVRRLYMKQGKMPKREEAFAPMYSFLRGLGTAVQHSFLPFTVHHMERAQMDAPYVMTGNHNSLLDPMLLAATNCRYHIRFIGKHELVTTKIGKWFFEKQLKMIPINRGATDMAAMRASNKVLTGGHVLGIFPEGTRHKTGLMETAHSGVALLALKNKAPILPVYLSDKPRLFRRVHVYVGMPFDPCEYGDGTVSTKSCEMVLEHLKQVYAELEAEHIRDNGRKN